MKLALSILFGLPFLLVVFAQPLNWQPVWAQESFQTSAPVLGSVTALDDLAAAGGELAFASFASSRCAAAAPAAILDDPWTALYGNDEFDDDDDNAAMLETVALYPNYPNPFNPATEIAFDLPETIPVTVCVYDVLGQTVSTLVSGVQNAGHHVLSFDGADLPAGMYFCKLTAPGVMQTRKMTLLR